jgi:GTP-binding protein
VADLPGTTRDPLFARFSHEGQEYEVLDTAGMKRLSRIKQDVDFYALVRAQRGLKGSEVALLTIDAEIGVTEQDKRVASRIEDDGRAIVIVINKADLITLQIAEQEEAESAETGVRTRSASAASPFRALTARSEAEISSAEREAPKKGHRMPDDIERGIYGKYIRRALGKLRWAELVYTSAVLRRGADDLLAAASRARANFHRRIDNAALRAVMVEAVTLTPPPVVKNRELRFFDFRQIGNRPPAFLIEVNDKAIMRLAYRRYLENAIRRHFDFAGTHIRVVIYEKRRKRPGKSR